MSVRFARPFFASGLAVLLLAGCSSGTPEQAVQANAPGKILSGEAFLTGLGLEGPATRRVRPDNRPRAELVLPPDRSLPPPEDDEALTAADWPNDPDVARAHRMAALRQEERYRPTADRAEPADNLSAAELRSGPDIPRSHRRGRSRPFGDWDYRDQAETTKTAAQLRRETALARAIRSRQQAAQSPSQSLMEPPADYQVAPAGAPPPPEKKRGWWPFGRR